MAILGYRVVRFDARVTQCITWSDLIAMFPVRRAYSLLWDACVFFSIRVGWL